MYVPTYYVLTYKYVYFMYLLIIERREKAESTLGIKVEHERRPLLPAGRAGQPDFRIGRHGPQFFKITGGYGQRAAKSHGLLTSTLKFELRILKYS